MLSGAVDASMCIFGLCQVLQHDGLAGCQRKKRWHVAPSSSSYWLEMHDVLAPAVNSLVTKNLNPMNTNIKPFSL